MVKMKANTGTKMNKNRLAFHMISDNQESMKHIETTTTIMHKKPSSLEL